jgi:hypothetical protein
LSYNSENQRPFAIQRAAFGSAVPFISILTPAEVSVAPALLPVRFIPNQFQSAVGPMPAALRPIYSPHPAQLFFQIQYSNA